MGFVDGSMINLATFPGVLLHQFMRLLACRRYGVEAVFFLANFTNFLQSNLVTVAETAYETHGKRIKRLALFASALMAMLCGAINDFTPINSVAEWIVLWFAISIGVQAFPSENRTAKFLWFDAVYGMLLYMLGKVPLGAPKKLDFRLRRRHWK
jgi:hypothetical protein